MKHLFFILFLFCISAAQAQNPLHTAFNANGPIGECLFPQNANGEIILSDIVPINDNADDIHNSIKAYIESYALQHDIKLKASIDEKLKLTYHIEYPIGKQLWTITVLGNPVFAESRDASKVRFTCTFEFRNGKFRYVLTDFETSRRMIQGEGKNNGPSNLIHWQRVNSLTKERNQYLINVDSTKRKVREILYDYDSQIAYEWEQYHCEYEHITDFVNKLKKVTVANASNDFSHNFDLNTPTDSTEPSDSLDLSEYKGNLLAQGNSVYLPIENLQPYEIVGVNELIKQITIDGFWKVVDNPNKAHFIIEYHVDTKGRDSAYIILRAGDGIPKLAYFEGSAKHAGENGPDNKEAARAIYMSTLYRYQKSMKKGNTPILLNIFERW